MNAIEYIQNQYSTDEENGVPIDIITHGHRVGIISYYIAEKLYLSHKIRMDVLITGWYHDYGKILIEKSILNKPGVLTQEEYEEIKKHAYYSSIMVQKYRNFERFSDIILYHHENIDGSGYYGLHDDEIPLQSKILAVADVYDALCSDRVYRRGYTMEKAFEIMEKEKYKYDPSILHSLFRLEEKNIIKPHLMVAKL